jgi:hypothetical protein
MVEQADSGGRSRSDDDLGSDPLWRAATEQVRKAVTTIGDDLKKRQAAKGVWAQALRAMQDGRVETAARLLGDERLGSSNELYPHVVGTIKNLRLAVQRALEARRTALLRAIEVRAGERGWRVQVQPDHAVIDGLLTVAIAADGTVKVQSRSLRTLVPGDVLATVEDEHARVWGRARAGVEPFEAELAELIREASREADPQGYMRLRDLYNTLKSRRPAVPGRLVSYYRDEFSADLSCVAQHPQYRRRFQYSAARDPSLAFPVILDDGQLYQYGYIRLRPEASDAHTA